MVFSCRILLLSLFFYLFISSHAYAAKATTILLFGDSIVAGYGLPKRDTLSERMQKLLAENKVTVVNGGISGDTTTGGKSRLAWTIEKYKPDIVILALGGNDMLRGISPKLVSNNLEYMLNILKSKNIITILQAVKAAPNMGRSYVNEFDNIYPQLANKYDVILYPFFLSKTYANPKLMLPDGIHPNEKGIELIAEDLVKFIMEKKIL